VTEGVSDQMYM